jgi:hypothetical protein
MHTALKQNKEEKKEKKMSRYNDLFLVAAVQHPPRQHPNSKFSKSGTFKKEIVHKRHRRPIIDHMFTLEKVCALKTMPSTRSLLGTIN